MQRQTSVRSSHCLLLPSTLSAASKTNKCYWVFIQCRGWFHTWLFLSTSHQRAFPMTVFVSLLDDRERLLCSDSTDPPRLHVKWKDFQKKGGGKPGDTALRWFSDQIISLRKFTSVPWFIWRWVGRSEFDSCWQVVQWWSEKLASSVTLYQIFHGGQQETSQSSHLPFWLVLFMWCQKVFDAVKEASCCQTSTRRNPKIAQQWGCSDTHTIYIHTPDFQINQIMSHVHLTLCTLDGLYCTVT